MVTPDKIYMDIRDNYVLVPELQDQKYQFEAAEKIMRLAGIELIVDPSIRP